MILLTAAVDEELAFYRPRAGVTTLVTGVGPVESACAVAAALAQGAFALVINAGIAGAFEGAATVGDGVVVEEDSMELALESGAPLALPAGSALVDSARSDPSLVEALRARGFRGVRGLTVARVTSSEATARRLHDLGAQVESMEGFAVLRAAARAGVAAIEVRGISNRCGDRSCSGWDFRAGVEGLQKILYALLDLHQLRVDATA